MVSKQTNYVAKKVDANGFAAYTEEDNAIWKELVTRQQSIVKNRACEEYIKGLELLALPQDRIPQCSEVSQVLKKATGWVLQPVPALISFDHFFELLSTKRFPAATFIRRKEDLDYIKEPDIFHEIFGHCPLLTNPAYAEFTHTYGKLGMKASHEERILLARLFWFTIEFGLINTSQGTRAYGGGILSSFNETFYSVESEVPKRKAFSVMDILNTEYRIDMIQPVYYIINNFDELYHLIDLDLLSIIREKKLRSLTHPKHPC